MTDMRREGGVAIVEFATGGFDVQGGEGGAGEREAG